MPTLKTGWNLQTPAHGPYGELVPHPDRPGRKQLRLKPEGHALVEQFHREWPRPEVFLRIWWPGQYRYALARFGRDEVRSLVLLGVTVAAAKYDPDRDTRFVTCAAQWVRGTVEAAFRRGGRRARLPEGTHLIHADSPARARAGEPDGGNLWEVMGVAARPDSRWSLKALELREALDQVARQHLTERQRRVLALRLEGHLLEEIGQVMGYTRTRAQQVIATICDRLREPLLDAWTATR